MIFFFIIICQFDHNQSYLFYSLQVVECLWANLNEIIDNLSLFFVFILEFKNFFYCLIVKFDKINK